MPANCGYPRSPTKTPFSILDAAYVEAERLAKDCVYRPTPPHARALECIVAEANADRSTAAFNDVYEPAPERDEFLDSAAALALEDKGW